ncbi:MAG: glycosyltransferase 87 family protein [Pseudomonadota bacterium]
MNPGSRHPSLSRNVWIRIGLPAAVFILFASLAAVPDLSRSVALLVGLSGAIVILLALGQYLAGKGEGDWSPAIIIVVALLVRLLFIPEPPVLSDDLYRYIFDGLVTLQGGNPYSAAPDGAELLTREAASILPMINHAHLVTIYPPAAQLLFAAGAAAGKLIGPVPGMKLVFAGLDVGSCILILVLLRQLGLPCSRGILYAWNPLPVLEIAGSGHVDGAALLFILAALVLATRPGTGIAAGLFMGLAVLTKWVPLMIVPFWLLLVSGTRQRAAALGAFAVTGVLLAALFWPNLVNAWITLGQYLRNWEFSGFLFRGLRYVAGSGETARILLAALFTAVTGALFVGRVRRPPETAALFGCMAVVAGAYLVLSPTVYPWYALYLAVFLPFVRNPACLVFTWSVLFSYRILLVRHLTGLWVEDDVTPLLIVAAPCAALSAHALVRILPARRGVTHDREKAALGGS